MMRRSRVIRRGPTDFAIWGAVFGAAVGVALVPGYGFDLRLMSWGNGSGVPTSCYSLVIVGIDNNGLLHIRIFDDGGNRVTDTDETKLPSTQAGDISTLKQQVPGFLPPRVLTRFEKAQLIGEVTSVVGPIPDYYHFKLRRMGEFIGVYTMAGGLIGLITGLLAVRVLGAAEKRKG